MIVSSQKAFRALFKQERPNLRVECNNPNFIGTEKNGEYGFFSMYHGLKQDIRGFLQADLNMAEDDQAIFEFLQNAVDCHATLFDVYYDNESFCVINNGEQFNKEGIISILNIGQSTKHDANSIGRLGVGFKLAHRLVGKQNGLEELLNDYKGPIVFSWNSYAQLQSFISYEDSIEIASDWRESYAHLFKILITNFPCDAGETVFDLNHVPQVLFSSEELNEMRSFIREHISMRLNNPSELSHGTITFLKLGEGKRDRLESNRANLIDGIQYSMNLFGSLNSISLNGEVINKKELVLESGHIEISSDQFASIEPEYTDYLIQYSFGFVPVNGFDDADLTEIANLTEAPNFFKYFPMGEENDGYGIFVHSDSFRVQSNRRELTECVTNEKLLPIIAQYICDSLTSYQLSDPQKYKQLYASILLSKPQNGWLKDLFWSPILAYIKTHIPLLEEDGYSDVPSNVKVRETTVDIDLSAIGLENIRWFCWDNNNKLLKEAALDSNKLDLYPWDITNIIRNADSKKLYDWLNSIPKDHFDLFLKELSEYKKDSSGLSELPLFEFDNETRMSYDELDLKDGLVLCNEKRFSIKTILQKLGYTCSVGKIEDHILYSLLSSFNLGDKSLFDDIKSNRDLTILTSSEKHELFNAFKDFDNIGPETLKALPIFSNRQGNLCPMSDMIKYSPSCEAWLDPFIICDSDYDSSLDEYLISNDKVFSNLISSHYDEILDGGLSPLELYEKYSGSWTLSMTKTLLNKFGATEDMITIIEREPKTESIVALLDKLPLEVYRINSDTEYLETSLIYRIIALVAAQSEDSIKETLRRKIYIDDVVLTSFTVKDELNMEWKDKRTYSLRLSEVLPNNQQGAIFSKVAEQFSKISGYKSIFSSEKTNYESIRQQLTTYLNDGDKSINPQQYAFCMLLSFRQNCNGFITSIRDSIRIKNDVEVLNIISYFFEQEWADLLKDNIENYCPNSVIRNIVGKYLFSEDYTIEEERAPMSIETWCGSDENKKEFLKTVGLRFNDCEAIIRRKSFKENTLEGWGSELKTAPNAFLNWVKTFAPISGDKQIQILRNLSFNSYVRSVRVTRNITEDYSAAIEWDDPQYLKWKRKGTRSLCKSIKFLPGEMPVRIMVDDMCAAKTSSVNLPDYYYHEGVLYVNEKYRSEQMRGIISQVVSSQSSSYNKQLTQEDWDTLFMIDKEEYLELKKQRDALKQQNDLLVEQVGEKRNRGSLSTEQRISINREARMAAYDFLSLNPDYDCSEWEPSTSGQLVSCIKYKGDYIKVAIISSGAGTLHLHPYVFAELMENPNNLLLNYIGGRISKRSYNDLFLENPDVNIIFDTDIVNNPEIIAKIVNLLRGSQRSCFAIGNRDYSASDEIAGFGLDQKIEGEYQNYSLNDDILFNW